MIQFGLMRAVAFGTFSRDDRFVFAFNVLDLFAGIGTVARSAQKALFGDDHSRDIAPMGVMASQAFTVFEEFVVGTFGNRFY